MKRVHTSASRRAPWCAGLAVGLALAAGPAGADTLGDQFQRANQAFLAGDDAAAIAGYRQLVDADVDDTEVYFNLATAYRRKGLLGRAIQFYERALRLRPGDEGARRALESTRAELDRTLVTRHPEARVKERPPLFAAIADGVSSGGAAAAFLSAWVLLFGALFARRFVRAETPRLVVGIVTVAAGLGSVGTGGFLASKVWSDHRAHEAIVVAEEIHALAGPGRDFEETWRTVEGTRVRVLVREGRWVLVRGPSDREGWVPRGQIGAI